MGREPKVLEVPLYDERIPPGIEAAELLPAVERLVKRKQLEHFSFRCILDLAIFFVPKFDGEGIFG
jgi:hypothetical protein